MSTVRAGRRVGTDLTEGNITKVLLLFAFPLLLSNIIQQLYNTVDLIIIGQYMGSTGTVGVSTGGEAASMFTFVSMGFASAGQIYVSQLYGRHDHARIQEAIGTLLTFMGIISAAAMLLSLVLCDPILRLMNTPAEAFEQAHNYMMITAVGLPFVFGYNAVCSILRGMGESRRPLVFIIIAAISNIIMDVLLVVVFRLEAAGTAIATILAQFASFAASVVFMFRKREHFGFDFRLKSWIIRKEPFLIYLRLGIPLTLHSIFIHFSQIFCNSLINGYGLIPSACNSVGNKITRFANILMNSITQASGTMIGQNLGAGKFDRVQKTVRVSITFSYAICVMNCLLSVLVPRFVYSIFTKDQAVIEMGVLFLRINLITFILSAWMGPFGAVVTGTGNSKINFIAGMLDGVILRIGISLLCAYVFHMEVYGFFLGNALARLAPCTIYAWYYFSGRWKTHRLLKEEDAAPASGAA